MISGKVLTCICMWRRRISKGVKRRSSVFLRCFYWYFCCCWRRTQRGRWYVWEFGFLSRVHTSISMSTQRNPCFTFALFIHFALEILRTICFIKWNSSLSVVNCTAKSWVIPSPFNLVSLTSLLLNVDMYGCCWDFSLKCCLRNLTAVVFYYEDDDLDRQKLFDLLVVRLCECGMERGEICIHPIVQAEFEWAITDLFENGHSIRVCLHFCLGERVKLWEGRRRRTCDWIGVHDGCIIFVQKLAKYLFLEAGKRLPPPEPPPLISTSPTAHHSFLLRLHQFFGHIVVFLMLLIFMVYRLHEIFFWYAPKREMSIWELYSS